MPGKMKKLRYHLVRALTHPQLLSLLFAVVVIVAWVHWRQPVGELKLNSWVAVIFLAIIFRPAIVELLRRTDKISTSWAQLSMKQLKEDVEKAESLEEESDPKVIEVANFVRGASGDLVLTAPEVSVDGEDKSAPPPDRYKDTETIREQATNLLRQIPDFDQAIYRGHRKIITIGRLRYRLQDLIANTEQLVLQYFGPEDGPNEFTSEVAEYIAAWTGVSGWTNVVDVWRRAKKHVFSDWPNAETSRTEVRLIETLVRAAMDILNKQLEAVARVGRTD